LGFWFRFFVFWFRRAPCARGCLAADVRGLGFGLRSWFMVLGFRRCFFFFFLPVGSPRWGHPVESRRTNSGAVIGRSFSNLAAGRPASSSARAVLRSAVLSRPSLSLLQILQVSAQVYIDCIWSLNIGLLEHVLPCHCEAISCSPPWTRSRRRQYQMCWRESCPLRILKG